MSNITAVLARVVVPDLDAAIPLYQALSGALEVQRFAFADVELASVGPFLLLSGPHVAEYSNRVATLLVDDLEPVIHDITEAGGEILNGPDPAPNGARLIARHPDGAVFEYIETGRKHESR